MTNSATGKGIRGTVTGLSVAFGANLPSFRGGTPRDSLEAAIALLPARGIAPRVCSRWYRSPPWPSSGQPWYVNGVVLCETLLPPEAVMTALHELEEAFGRRRRHPNQARPLDLDLIDYGGRVTRAEDWPRLPHPRLQDRAFVLRPLAEVAPGWRDPRNGTAVADLLTTLPEDGCWPL
ncbi:MAG: 2-amino-4-hydroxy-6-hydroxymethyldihydropteridine diphosphokinase [Rhodospirillales bacterium]|nr:2-amino-4-hydroxy-6-hydroxymethyldihydropteridine diphosphokinase [Rhodospirillales bacterium]